MSIEMREGPFRLRFRRDSVVAPICMEAYYLNGKGYHCNNPHDGTQQHSADIPGGGKVVWGGDPNWELSQEPHQFTPQEIAKHLVRAIESGEVAEIYQALAEEQQIWPKNR